MKLTIKYKDSSDRELWERCRAQGDELAFDEIFNRYFKRLLRIAVGYTKNSMVAEELAMDCLFNLWTKREQLNIEGEFSNYLFKCAYHSIVYHLRKEAPIVVGLEEMEFTLQAEQASDHTILSDDVRRIYQASLEKLSPRRKEVFILSRQENLSYPEIAKKMNISVSAVNNYITAALESLRMDMRGCFPTILLAFLLFF